MKQKKIPSALLLLGLPGLVLGVGLLHTMYQTYRSGQRIETLRRQVQELRVEKEQLEKELAYRQGSEFIEREARDKLNLLKPGEAVVVLDRQRPKMVGRASTGGEGQSALPNFRQWLQLFF